jgi:hypothetical protein
VDNKQIALTFRKLPIRLYESSFQKVAVIAPEKFVGKRAIGGLHLDVDVAAVTFDGEFEAMLAAASRPWPKLKPTTTGQIPRREAFAYGRKEVVVVNACEAGPQVCAVLATEQTDLKRSREVSLPRCLKRPQVLI